jgi:hypothetical protein
MKSYTKITCKEASFLINKKQEASISIIEKLQLSVHLFYCKACTRFYKQTNVLLKLLSKKINQNAPTTLSTSKKESIQKVLSKAINNE